MSQLLIELDTPEDEALLRQLRPKLNGRILESKSKRSLTDVLNQLGKQATLGASYGEPSDWQRDIRQDRPAFELYVDSVRILPISDDVITIAIRLRQQR